MPRVSVQLDWPAGVTAVPSDARAVVTVEDVSRADAASTVVASTELTDLDVSHPAVAEVDVPEVDPSANLVVRVRVTASAEGTRDVSMGDLITTRSHPVLTRGHGDSVVVPLTKVGG